MKQPLISIHPDSPIGMPSEFNDSSHAARIMTDPSVLTLSELTGLTMGPGDVQLYVMPLGYMVHIDHPKFNDDYSLTIDQTILDGVANDKIIIVLNYSFEGFDFSALHNSYSNPNSEGSKLAKQFEYKDRSEQIIINTMSKYGLRKDQVLVLTGNLYPVASDLYTTCSLNAYEAPWHPLSDENSAYLAEHGHRIDHFFHRKFKVVAFNHRAKPHRIAFAKYVFDNNLRDGNLVTMRPIDNIDKLADLQIDETFVKSLPWEYDIKTANTTGSWIHDTARRNDIWGQPSLDSYVNYVSEVVDNSLIPNTRELAITEKTYIPIVFCKPFIIQGFPNTLKELRKQGYMTFDRWWDESYDQTGHLGARREKTFGIFKMLSEMSHSKLAKMLREMRPILEENYCTLKSRLARNAHAELLVPTVERMMLIKMQIRSTN